MTKLAAKKFLQKMYDDKVDFLLPTKHENPQIILTHKNWQWIENWFIKNLQDLNYKSHHDT